MLKLCIPKFKNSIFRLKVIVEIIVTGITKKRGSQRGIKIPIRKNIRHVKIHTTKNMHTSISLLSSTL